MGDRVPRYPTPTTLPWKLCKRFTWLKGKNQTKTEIKRSLKLENNQKQA